MGIIKMRNNSDVKTNWFAVNRSLINSEFWTSEKFTKPQAWIDLIGLARHTDGVEWRRGIKYPVLRGQLSWSEQKLGVRWMWSRMKVRRFLSVLSDDGQVKQEKNNLRSLTTIIDYDLYQPNDLTGGM
jgi:hypothetical protein